MSSTAMSLTEKLTYSTVLIRCKYANNTSGSGTGFIINLCSKVKENYSIPVLVTNQHVVANSIETVFEFCCEDKAGKPIDTKPITFTYGGNSWLSHPDPDVDLCCLPIGPQLNALIQQGSPPFYIPLTTDLIPSQEAIEELSAMEDIIMIGYPIGLSDQYNHKPVIRRGITATHPKKDYQGKKEILVDMACFPGSSGSPVFIFNEGAFPTATGVSVGSRILFIGVLYGGPQYNAQGVLAFAQLPNMPTPIVQIPTNLGIMIKAEKVLEFEKLFNTKELT